MGTHSSKMKLSKSHINSIINNPGFFQISQNIFGYLSHQDQLNSRFVCQSWKSHIDEPHFWIKKLVYKGQSKELRDAWIDVAQRVEKGSDVEEDLTKCLMTWHKEIGNWKEDNIIGVSPIYVGARYGNFKIVEHILSYIADPNPVKSDGWTPIHLSSRYGHTEIFKLLASKVENINAPKPDGWTSVHLSARYGHLEIFKLLASKVENANAPMPDGWTPAHLAAKEGHTEIIKMIGAVVDNPNVPLPDGRTPLQLAIEYKQTETAVALFKILNNKIDSNPEEILNTMKK